MAIKCAIIADPDKVGNKLNAIAPAADVLLNFIYDHPEIMDYKVSRRDNARTIEQFVKELRDDVDDLVDYMDKCQISGTEKIINFIDKGE